MKKMFGILRHFVVEVVLLAVKEKREQEDK